MRFVFSIYPAILIVFFLGGLTCVSASPLSEEHRNGYKIGFYPTCIATNYKIGVVSYDKAKSFCECVYNAFTQTITDEEFVVPNHPMQDALDLSARKACQGHLSSDAASESSNHSSANESFSKQAVLDSFVWSCAKNQKQGPSYGLSQKEVADYCRCVGNKYASILTTDDLNILINIKAFLHILQTA